MPNSMWHQCLEVLRDEFPAQQFNTWLRPLQSDHRDGLLMLFAPNRFVMDWVNEKYLRRIEEVLKDLNGGQAPRVQMKVGSAPKPDDTVARSVPEVDETGHAVTEEEKSVAATAVQRTAEPSEPVNAPAPAPAPSSSANQRRSVQV
ncbi:MAG: DnaA N-terminal domain-containing protein, partial [Marinobacter sp.]